MDGTRKNYLGFIRHLRFDLALVIMDVLLSTLLSGCALPETHILSKPEKAEE
jgi:hypothetical protein